MKNIAVFASGNGSNFEAIVNAVNNGTIKANIKFLFCDKPEAYCLTRANNLGIKSYAFRLKDFDNKEEYEKRIVAICKNENIDLIVLAGYMKICDKVLLDNYEGKIINIHPALLPSFKGAHGIRDAYLYGVKVFGVTIHYVNSSVDGGKIIAQDIIDYHEGDSLEEVERKIHELEYILYVKTIKKLTE